MRMNAFILKHVTMIYYIILSFYTFFFSEKLKFLKQFLHVTHLKIKFSREIIKIQLQKFVN